MRRRWTCWLLAVLIVSATVAWYVGLSTAIHAEVGRLADQPSVQTAFQSEGASSDALILLISVAVLAPIATGLLILGLEFAVNGFELVLSRLHLPEWASTPVVLWAVASGIYAMREAWWPESLHVLGLVARAYLVFSSSVPSPPT